MAISPVFVVMLEVFEFTLVSNAVILFLFALILLDKVTVSLKLKIVFARNGWIKLGNWLASILSFNFNLIAAAVSIIACLFFVIKIESLPIRFESPIVSLPIRLLNIVDVSEIFNFVLILLDNEIVSLPIRLLNIADVSEYFIPDMFCK